MAESESAVDTTTILRDEDLMTNFDPLTVIDQLTDKGIISEEEFAEFDLINEREKKLAYLLPLVERNNESISSFIAVLENSRSNRNLGRRLKQLWSNTQPEDNVEFVEDPTRNPYDFGSFQIYLISQLRREHCEKLLVYFNCTPSARDKVVHTDSPGLQLVEVLKELNIIKQDDVKELIKGLRSIQLKSALLIAQQYQALIDNSPQPSSAEIMSPFYKIVLNSSLQEISAYKTRFTEIITGMKNLKALRESDIQALKREGANNKFLLLFKIMKHLPDDAYFKFKQVLKDDELKIFQKLENRQALKDPKRREQLFCDIKRMSCITVDSEIISHFVKDEEKSYNVLLIGKTGSGKSSTGNTLIGRKTFNLPYSRLKSCTKTVELQTLLIPPIKVNVMDTPGLFDTKKKGNIDILLEITKAALQFPEGFDALIIVCRLDSPFTSEEEATILEIENFFGDELYKHSLLVFTHGNEMKKNETLDSNICETQDILQDLYRKVSKRCLAIENNDEVVSELHKEVLLSAFFQLIQQKDGEKYSHEIFKDVMKRQQEWKERDQKLDEVKKFIHKFVQNVIKNSDAETLQSLCKGLKLDRSKQMVLENSTIIVENALLLSENKVSVQNTVHRYLLENRRLIELLIVREEEKRKRDEAEREQALQTSEKAIHEALIKKNDTFTEEELNELIKNGKLSNEMYRELHKLVEVDNAKMESFVRNFCNNNKASLQSTLHVKVEERKKRDLEMKRNKDKKQVDKIVKKNVNKFIEKFGKKEMIKMRDQIKKGIVPKGIQQEIKSKLPPHSTITDDELHSIVKTVLKDNLKLIEEVIEKHCFPATATVVTEKSGTKSISQLRVGDKVLTVQSSNMLQYEDVFFIAHSDSDVTANYVKIQTESGAEIVISPNHCIPIGSINRPRPASEIAVENIVFSVKGHNVVPDRVTSITNVTLRGAYCPYTHNGTIVVNNVVASCFSNTVSPILSQSLLSPLRMMYKALPSPIYKMLLTEQTMVAISESARKWVQNFHYESLM